MNGVPTLVRSAPATSAARTAAPEPIAPESTMTPSKNARTAAMKANGEILPV